jgi:hypothetical protein
MGHPLPRGSVEGALEVVPEGMSYEVDAGAVDAVVRRLTGEILGLMRPSADCSGSSLWTVNRVGSYSYLSLRSSSSR